MQIRSFFLASWVCACALGLTSACSGSNNNSSGGGSGNCNSYSTALCNKFEQCAPLDLQLVYGDVQTCIARSVMSCNAGMTLTPVPPAQLSACSSAVSQLDCQVFVRGNSQPEACAFTGSLANGKACGSEAQCQSGYCNLTNGTCGTCAPRATTGGACTSTYGCQNGLVCNSSKVCAKPLASGGSCTATSDCAAGLVCVSGKCAAPVALGQPCTLGACNEDVGEFCNGQVCAKLQLAATGQPCGFVNGKEVECSGGGTCRLAQGQQQGTCVAPAKDGASCDATNGPDCLSPASCDNGKCNVPDPSSCK